MRQASPSCAVDTQLPFVWRPPFVATRFETAIVPIALRLAALV